MLTCSCRFAEVNTETASDDARHRGELAPTWMGAASDASINSAASHSLQGSRRGDGSPEAVADECLVTGGVLGLAGDRDDEPSGRGGLEFSANCRLMVVRGAGLSDFNPHWATIRRSLAPRTLTGTATQDGV